MTFALGTPDFSLRSHGTLPDTFGPAEGSYAVGAMALVRQFVDHLLVGNTATALGGAHPARHPVDWAAIEASVGNCRSLEQAIGRAVVIADQMSRGLSEETHLRAAKPPIAAGEESALTDRDEDPFFAFSMADAIPDFGDESRYRTKVANKVARAFGVQRTIVTPAVAP